MFIEMNALILGDLNSVCGLEQVLCVNYILYILILLDSIAQL